MSARRHFVFVAQAFRPEGVRLSGEIANEHTKGLTTEGVSYNTQNQLQATGSAEFTDNLADVALIRVDLFIEVAHVHFGEFAGEIAERFAELRELLQGGFADDGDGIVGREI